MTGRAGDAGAPGHGGGAEAAGPELAAVMEGCRRAHDRLVGEASALGDDAVHGPSRLPGWTRGHVLTHLARNADSHTRMLRAALAGEAVEQYAGGAEERSSAIDAGAGRGAGALHEDVRRSVAALESAWAAMTPAAWDGHGLARGHPWPCRSLPAFRWREVEIHLVDLDTGYGPDDWPEPYVRLELPSALATVPGRLPGPVERARLLAWLVGRGDVPAPLELDRWESRPSNYFAAPPG